MKRALTAFLLLISLFPGKILSAEMPRISLLTCTPGNELYSTFGHSALRVSYPDGKSDLVFNFGLFDFDTPNFYSKFMRGKLKYMLGIQHMNDFIAQYNWEGRGVAEQVLNLDSVQTINVLSRLEYLYRPENRYYLYSFLYKNCTSELRDIIFDAAEADREALGRGAGKTNRDLINEYIGGWTKFGINIILGSTLDREVDVFQTMFLPDYLYNELTVASNGDVPLVSDHKVILEKSESSRAARALLSPMLVFSLIALIIGYVLIRKRFLFIDLSFLTIIGLLGLFLSVIILITDHRELYSNFNLLWCNPLYLILAVTSLRKWRKASRVLGSISLMLLFALVVVWVTGVQYAEPGFIVLSMILALSSFMKVFAKD